jgi:hypothetical protein
MSENLWITVKIHPRRMTRLRDGRHRRLAMEQLERRWLLSAAVKATSPAAAWATDCDGQGGWADVGPSGSGSSGGGSGYQGDSTASSWSASGANQLPAKKPGLLVLSPDQLRANAAGEGGLVDVTRMSNQPPMALLDAAPPLGGAADNGRNEMALRPASGSDRSTEPALSALPAVKLEGLRGTSQAFDVAVSPVRSSAGGATLNDPNANLRFRPATVWPMPMLPRERLGIGDSPTTSALPDSAPLPGDGKTTFTPAHPPAAVRLGSSAASASAPRIAAALPSSGVAASDNDAKNLHGKTHDRVFAHVADFVHELSVAARLNDRRVEAAVVAVALAAMPYRRFRRRHDTTI